MIKYTDVQEAHYKLAETNVLYRIVSLSVFSIFAPIIIPVLWSPIIVKHMAKVVGEALLHVSLIPVAAVSVVHAYIVELIGFYSYVPRGLRGERRHD